MWKTRYENQTLLGEKVEKGILVETLAENEVANLRSKRLEASFLLLQINIIIENLNLIINFF